MRKVSEVLENKGYDIWSISSVSSVFDAIKLMAEKAIGALVVIDNSELVGMISERDYTRKVILKGHSSKDTLVREIMSNQIICALPEQNIDECMALMTENRVRHLPVMGEENIIGVISIGDLVKSTIDEQKFIIKRLEHHTRTSGAVHKWMAK